jgi:hypothetical protein
MDEDTKKHLKDIGGRWKSAQIQSYFICWKTSSLSWI